ncbi:MAG TPA: S8 family serine peptidase [Flavisolibacter sp.]|nr:S8 family serine peptidase [Flavisolibacter sp.]
MKRIFFLFSILLVSFSLFSQQTKEKKAGWHLLDQQQDGYMGISLAQAYDLLKNKKSRTVIVAVIDSGIDTTQEDLKPVLWINTKEINGNGIDDDKNGYTDDIHGWNFCGSKEGENLSRNSHEIARVYHNWRTEFEGKKEKNIPAEKKFLYSQWIKAASIIEKDFEEASKQLPDYTNFLNALEISSKTICEELSVKEFGPLHAKTLLNSNKNPVAKSAALWVDVFSQTTDTSIKHTVVIKEISDYKNTLNNKIKRKEDKPEDTRGSLTKDNYFDISDRFYGNNNLKAHSGDHGTLVAGVIGAVRNNGIGIDGIADNVRIMAIRAVPGGDEHDKDVALAIRYAVDNGASIINMSFGKPVSPFKHLVDEATKYAASKGVLLVHGSGNDGKDISKDVFYPNPIFLDGTKATNYITVGASGDETTGGYAASFSNYSKSGVDVFAPGMFIYSTATDNRYSGADGTSLASPVVAGVAALLKSYFPQLKPEQMVRILTTSGKTIQGQVSLPGEENKKVSFSTLSSSGKVVNAYEAVKMALEMENDSKKAF